MSISSKLLVEDENRTAMPKFHLFISMFFNRKNILGCFEQSNCLDISIIEFLAFSLRLISVSKECLKVRFC